MSARLIHKPTLHCAQRTTPNEARTILNSQPQIAYALMSVMVNINAVKMEVVQVRAHNQVRQHEC